MSIKITMIQRYYKYVCYLNTDFNLRKYVFLMNICCGRYGIHGIQIKMKFKFTMNL